MWGKGKEGEAWLSVPYCSLIRNVFAGHCVLCVLFFLLLGGGGGRGYDSSHFLRTENSFGIIWSSPRQLRVKNTLRVGHRGPVGRKTTQKPPQNTKKWKKIVKKRLFSRFGHFGQNSDFSRKKSKTGIFFDITKPPLAQIYPKSGL